MRCSLSHSSNNEIAESVVRTFEDEIKRHGFMYSPAPNKKSIPAKLSLMVKEKFSVFSKIVRK